MRKYIIIILCLLGSVSMKSQDSDLQKGLMGYWPFDAIDAGAELNDYSGHNAHATTTGAMATLGVRGSGLRFDGKDDVVTILNSRGSIPSHLGTLGQGTISLWFKLNEVPDGKGIQPIFYFGSWTECANVLDAANQGIVIEVGHHPLHYESKRLYFTIFSNGCTGPSFCFDSWVDMEADRWYHFAAVVGEDFNNGYLDGNPLEPIYYSFGNETYSQFFDDAKRKDVIWLGKGFWNTETYYLNGSIDELRIYNRPLSDQEINDLYHETLSTEISPDKYQARINIYPNPVNKHLHFSWQDQNLRESIEEIVIIDAGGKVLRVEGPARSIDLEGLKQGYYMALVYGKSGVWRFPFLKVD